MNGNWILNSDRSIYHLKLTPNQVAKIIITVGDPERVPKVSQYFDRIEHIVQSREFLTHTGYIGTKRITVISTGIGTDNIDIVLNELDALFNINFETGKAKETITQLNIIRLGTSGAIQEEIELDQLLISNFCVGLDGLMPFYENSTSEFIPSGIQLPILQNAYLSSCSRELLSHFADSQFLVGNTVTAAGFYGPQGRSTRIPGTSAKLLKTLSSLEFPFGKITNLEMETAGIYGLSTLLGHRAISINAILVNRISNTFSNQAENTIRIMIESALEKIIRL